MKIKLLHILVFSVFLLIKSASAQTLPSNVPSNGLVGWWPFNGTAYDLSPNNHDGNEFQVVPATDRFGLSDRAFFFNGASSYIEVPHHQDFNTMPISFSYWIKSAGDIDGGQIINKYCCSTWDGYNIQVFDMNGGNYPETFEYAYFRGTCNGIFQTYCNPFPFPIDSVFNNQWYHFVFIVDTSGAKVYRNGILFMEQDWFTNAGNDPVNTVTPITNNLPLTFGRSNIPSGPGSYFSGIIDDIGIWDRALTEAEVIALYGNPNEFCSPSVRVFPDYNQSCVRDVGEYSSYISQHQLVIEPEEIYVLTDNVGDVYLCGLELADGPHQVTLGSNNSPWTTDCPETIDFNVQGGVIQTLPEFGLYSTSPCPQPDITIFCPTIRRCSEHSWPIYVNACNLPSGTDIIQNGYVEVALDSFMFIESATLPYQDLGSFMYRFDVGNLSPGQCNNFIINVNFGCEYELNETVCMEARLFPVSECELDDEGEFQEDYPCTTWTWDQSRLDVSGWCSGDSVYFDVKNIGDGNMDCFRQVNLFVDYGLQETDSVKLNAGAQRTFQYACSGETYIMKANQHPFHPGNSHPTDFVENCGGSNWTPGVVNCYPHDDEDPVVDIFCGTVVGSFDPNDKTGYPLGFGPQHGILPGQKINYVIRFQNTGTAEAYNVVVRDTLETDLDILSIVMGPVSHNYTFQIKSPRVLEWTFANIMLPDSNSNEEESHGFITFTINQINGLLNGTEITNSAAIYFDSNDPVITNTTLHTINDQLHIIAGTEQLANESSRNDLIRVYPNPVNSFLTVVKYETGIMPYEITDIIGRKVSEGLLTQPQSLIDVGQMPSGIYFLRILSANQSTIKFVKD